MSSADPAIRPAEIADDAALRALDVATWSPENSPGPRSDPDQPFFSTEDGPADVLVATVGDRVAGYVRLHAATRLVSNAHVLQIRGLAVAPRDQRRGLGRMLIEAAIREASRRGARRITLRVLGSNPAARAAYESCGFEVEGVMRSEFLIGNRYVDDVLMALEIT